MGESELKGLIASAKQGDERAFAELTRRVIEQRSEPGPASSPARVAPVVAATLCDAVRACETSGRPPSSRWFAWLQQLVGRSRQQLRAVGANDSATRYQRPQGDSVSDSSHQLRLDPDHVPEGSLEAALHAEVERLAHRSLKALPEPDRAILELRYWMRCTMPELARRLDCTEAEAARRLRLAVGSFRREMIREDETRELDT
ncbi:MAG: RNA polymerase sigma factor [Maioricimonas sp. JB049]